MATTEHVGQAGDHHQDGEDGSHADLAAQQRSFPGQLPLHAVGRSGWTLAVAAGEAGGRGAHWVRDIGGLALAWGYPFKLMASS